LRSSFSIVVSVAGRRQIDQPALMEFEQQRPCGHVFESTSAIAPVPLLGQVLRQPRS
jgi:hypothetical protein